MKKEDSFLYKIYLSLEKPEYVPYGIYVQKFILSVIFINILSFSLRIAFRLPCDISYFLRKVEYITTLMFLIELILRYIVSGFDDRYKGIRGKIKYTFTPYTIVDILSILPLFPIFNYNTTLLKLLRFIRVFRFLRVKNYLRKAVSLVSFATAPIEKQILTLFLISVGVIVIFSYIYNSFKLSFIIFLQPVGVIKLIEKVGYNKLYFIVLLGVIELVLGLVIGSFLISSLTSTLVKITDKVNKGLISYKGVDHIVIVNVNNKLDFILEEIEKFFKDNYVLRRDLVIVVDKYVDVEKFRSYLNKFNYLFIHIISGDITDWSTFERAGVNTAHEIVFLNKKNEYTLKTLRALISTDKFINRKAHFVVEIEDSRESDRVYLNLVFSEIFKEKGIKNYTIIESKKTLGSVLNRIVVNNYYYLPLEELLTFEGNEIYFKRAQDVFTSEYFPLKFLEAYLLLDNCILIGITKSNKVVLNPSLDEPVEKEDYLILIMENDHSYVVKEVEKKNLRKILISNNLISIRHPSLKENKKIVVVGNAGKLHLNSISEFITSKSLDEIEYIIEDVNDYMKIKIWKELENRKDIDVILVDLEDDIQIKLVFFLRALCSKEFVKKVVFLVNDALVGRLLEEKEFRNNIIFSQKLVGKYIAQIIFNQDVKYVIDELTHGYGNEFYILNRSEYPDIFDLTYESLRMILLKNKMIYIGAFESEGVFIFNHKHPEKTKKILVLCEGV